MLLSVVRLKPACFEVPSFEQPRKKSLREILRFFWGIAVASDKSVKWPPIRSAEFFQRFISGR
jgi:hypothetical protein